MIITLVIVGIVSAVVMPRILGRTTFNAPIIRDQIVSQARIAQQSSLGRDSVTLTIQPNGAATTAVIASSSSGGTINSVSLPISEVTLTTDNSAVSCGVSSGANVVSNATPLNVNFGSLGNLINSGVSGSEASVTSALRICVNNEPALSVCISPSGFAYVGDCDD
jgi:type II secretory pathway pseudopilin PulG